MNKSEFLADLATKILWPAADVIADYVVAPVDQVAGPIMEYKVTQVVQLGADGTAQPPADYPFVVLGEGTASESAWAQRGIARPVGDTLIGLAYLEGLKAAGTINAYKGLEEFPVLGFFTCRVWVDDGAGEIERVIRVTYDGQGSATHKFVG